MALTLMMTVVRPGHRNGVTTLTCQRRYLVRSVEGIGQVVSRVLHMEAQGLICAGDLVVVVVNFPDINTPVGVVIPTQF